MASRITRSFSYSISASKTVKKCSQSRQIRNAPRLLSSRFPNFPPRLALIYLFFTVWQGEVGRRRRESPSSALLKFDAAGVGRLLSSSSSSSPGWVTGCPAGFQTDTPPAGRWPDGPREGKVGDVIASQRVCEMCREGKWGLGRRRLFSLLPNNSLLSG